MTKQEMLFKDYQNIALIVKVTGTHETNGDYSLIYDPYSFLLSEGRVNVLLVKKHSKLQYIVVFDEKEILEFIPVEEN